MGRKKALILLLVIPFSLFVISHLLPFFYGIYLSFFDWRGNYVGFRNYLAVFNDRAFWDSIRFTFIYSGTVTLGMTVVGLFIGVFINSLGFGQGFAKSVLLLPWAISLTAWGLLSQIALSQQFGVVNDLLLRFGFIESRIAWLGDPSMARLSVFIARIFRDVWFAGLLFLAACQLIPVELYEESRVSGAGVLQNFVYVTLPSLRTTIIFVGTILFIFSLQEFDLIFSLTGGGPGMATEVASLNIYRHGILYGDFEYGIAISTVWSLFISLFVVTIFAPLQRRMLEQ
ncbi:MAG TPA: sugar ABC transporter permease [Atribacteraceae bacterium]|nr:sugar ABC transporter permease [Atribacteraceae bacterium]